MNAKVVTLVSIAIVAGLLIALIPSKPSAQPTTLLVYCAAGLRKPVEAAALDYEREYGVKIQLQFGGSNTLLTNIEASKTGDLFVPADDSYLAMGRKKSLIAESARLASMKPVLAVKKGNPKGIRSLDDLLKPD